MNLFQRPESPPTDAEILMLAQTAVLPERELGSLRDRLRRVAGILAALGAPPKSPSLIHVDEAEGRHTVIPVGRGLVVGRGESCDVCIAESKSMSRRHFRVVSTRTGHMIEDLGSRNGTLVEGEEAESGPRHLRDGDFIHAGDLLFLFIDRAE